MAACSTSPLKGPRPDDWAQKVTDKPLRNMYKVSDSLYRSEKPDQSGFTFFQEQKVASVLDLRRTHKDLAVNPNPFTGKLYHIPIETAKLSDKEVVEALQILQKAPKPLVIHCAHGSDRTGTIVAMYRIIYQNWSKEQAIEEMKRGGYKYHWFYPNLIKYIENADIEKLKQELKSTN